VVEAVCHNRERESTSLKVAGSKVVTEFRSELLRRCPLVNSAELLDDRMNFIALTSFPNDY
jgi:hypothetical protein